MDLERISQAVGKRPGLILVDLIKGFTDPASPLGSESDAVVAANKTLLDLFRKRGWPVVFTTTLYRAETEARVFRARLPALNILTPDSQWVEPDQRLARQPNEPLVEKKWASGFFATDLINRLREADVDCLVVTGLTTSGCVRATALDALQYDYPVFIPRSAVGDRNQDAHEANLHDLHAKYADVLSLDDLMRKLESVS